MTGFIVVASSIILVQLAFFAHGEDFCATFNEKVCVDMPNGNKSTWAINAVYTGYCRSFRIFQHEY
jgi:hypothetical protein